MRRRAPRPVGAALDRLLGPLAPPTVLAQVQRAWPEAAGPAFARMSEPLAEHGGVVRVACDSAVWAQELDLMSQRVVDALNERLGRPAVKRLRCEVSRGR
jgi:predicted nucleic acid-binding Zn ribbon protein